MTSTGRKCLWCPDRVNFVAGRGWVHLSDNTTIRTYEDEHGVIRDDHIATPDYGDDS